MLAPDAVVAGLREEARTGRGRTPVQEIVVAAGRPPRTVHTAQERSHPSSSAHAQAGTAGAPARKRAIVPAPLFVALVLGAGVALRAYATSAPAALPAKPAAPVTTATSAPAADAASVPPAAQPHAGRPSAEVTPAPQVGRPFAAGNWEYTVHAVQRTKTIPGVVGTKEARGEFVLVGLTLRNLGPRPAGVYPWDFSLVDDTGAEYAATGGMYQYAPDWLRASGYLHGDLADGTGPLPPGGVQTRALVFDAAAEAHGLILRLRLNGVDIPVE